MVVYMLYVFMSRTFRNGRLLKVSDCNIQSLSVANTKHVSAIQNVATVDRL